eukprot:TRINITY_DN11051_c0_g1_i1.p1 TRINITY_DN11051_c0_g1~~TRINITY_DN11051_c0_g1_i1.p1  ORF type:complete len:378 (-),score=101.20 TRINITY_DN11051_c0_g1_i1:27-1160(-)
MDPGKTDLRSAGLQELNKFRKRTKAKGTKNLQEVEEGSPATVDGTLSVNSSVTTSPSPSVPLTVGTTNGATTNGTSKPKVMSNTDHTVNVIDKTLPIHNVKTNNPISLSSSIPTPIPTPSTTPTTPIPVLPDSNHVVTHGPTIATDTSPAAITTVPANNTLSHSYGPSMESFQFQQTNSETAHTIKVLQQTNSLLGSKNVFLTNQIRDLEGKLSKVEAVQQQTAALLKQSETEKNSLTESNQKLQSQRGLDSLSLKEKEKEILILKSQLHSIQSKFQEQVKTNQSLQLQNKEEVLALKGQIKVMELEKKQLEKEKNTLELKYSASVNSENILQNSLNLAHEKVKELESTNMEIVEQVKALELKLGKFSEKFKNVTNL